MNRVELSTKLLATTIAIAVSLIGARYIFRAETSVRASAPLDAFTEASRLVPPNGTERHGSTDATSGDFHEVVVENGMLSLDVRQQPMTTVLAAIARDSGVSINSSASIDARSVSMRIQRLPLRDGLERLLQNCDLFFYSSSGALRSVWIYDRGDGAQLVPVPPERWASTAEVQRKLNDGSPAERVSAVETLIARNGPGADDILNRALLDDSPEVRLRALDVALSVGVHVSRETLTASTYDSSGPVRALALETLVSSTAVGGAREGETQELMRRMLGDPDAAVRTRASELLAGRQVSTP